ncbi:MAG: mechanosensitive ion channel family protein [Ottowia sp.]|nr:mechanosensitive ion channel family protein [Ottowia sp.]
MRDAIWQTQWLGNSLAAWLAAAVGVAVAYGLIRLLVQLAATRLLAIAEHRPGRYTAVAAAVVQATRHGLLLLLALAVAASFLQLPARVDALLPRLIALLVGLQVAFWLSRLVSAALDPVAQPGAGARAHNAVIFGLLSWMGQLVVWVVLLLAILSNAGVNVNTFVASLGVGGIAVALAAQNVLGDLFASVSIGLDKPFVVGDYIAFDGNSGTVQRVGIKSTRIAALSGEEIAVSNTQLLGQRIHNYARMRERRIAFGFRVATDTPRDKVERIVSGVRELLSNDARVRLDRGHMTGFGEWSLDFEFVYYMLDPGFAVYRDTQQDINLGIMALLEELQVPLAIPARVVREAAAPAPGARPATPQASA